jgi:SAM-dependent methyltransferase
VNPTGRFSTRAKAYAAFRPSYPAGAIDAALDGLGDPKTLTIADVGAGTGISARLFAERGVTVIAIEPNARMRAAAEQHPRVSWHDGTAERTNLPGASVDAVVACQAFHWFVPSGAFGEFRRIARRRAAILQYERDERDAFTKAYGDVVRAYATDDTELLRQRALAAFAAFPNATVARSEHLSRQSLDREGLIGRASSASYLPSSGPDASRLHNDLNVIFDRYQRDGRVALVMATAVLVADW